MPNQAGFGVSEGVAHLFVNVLCQPSCKLWVGLKFGSNSILVCVDYNCSSALNSPLAVHPPTIYSDGWIGAWLGMRDVNTILWSVGKACHHDMGNVVMGV